METIALDLMGGDRAPEEVAKGALEAVAEMDVTIALIGTREALSAHVGAAAASGAQPGRIEPVVATQVVDMAESPTDSWRDKKDSSIAVGVSALPKNALVEISCVAIKK